MLIDAVDQIFDVSQVALAEMLSQASGEKLSGEGKHHSVGHFLPTPGSACDYAADRTPVH